jgi:hypothetical protein
MASRAASRPVCRRGDRRVGPVGDGKELSWQRVGRLSSSIIVGPVGLRLHDGGVFEPQAGAGDLRFGSVPLHRRERSSRPRHHRNVSAFRRRFLKDIEALFVRVLELAGEMGFLRMGTVGLDGTKIHANASRHSALSYEHAGKIEAHLQAEVAELLARAEAADQADVADGMSIPEELARREERLAKLAEARAKLEARAKERFEREMAEHRAKLAVRDETAASGKKPGADPLHRRSRGRNPKIRST